MSELRQGQADLASRPRQALAVLAVLTLYTALAEYLDAVGGGAKPLYFIAVLVVGSLAILALEAPHARSALASPLVAWGAVVLAMAAAWSIWRTSYSPDTDQAVADRVRMVGLLGALAVIFDDPRALRTSRIAVLLAALAASCLNLGETLGLVAFDDVLERTAGRAGGLYGNPNQAGLAIVFGVAAGIAVVPRALRISTLVVVAGGVAATFSRGALACLAVLVVVLVARGEVGWRSTSLAAAGVVAAIALKGNVLRTVLDVSGTLNRDTLGRLAMSADDSGRGLVAARAWRLFLDAPWFGHGLATEPAGRVAHNMYLRLAAEHGIFGLLLFPALVGAVLASNRAALGMAAVCLVAGLTSHTILDDAPTLLCIVLAAARPEGAPGAVRARPESTAGTMEGWPWWRRVRAPKGGARPVDLR